MRKQVKITVIKHDLHNNNNKKNIAALKDGMKGLIRAFIEHIY